MSIEQALSVVSFALAWTGFCLGLLAWRRSIKMRRVLLADEARARAAAQAFADELRSMGFTVTPIPVVEIAERETRH